MKKQNLIAAAMLSVLTFSCGLFEPREAEQPTQSGATSLPATSADNVIANLKSSVTEKNVVNYTGCFANPPRTTRSFVFVPSDEAATRYARLRQWSVSDESDYFRSMVNLAQQRNGFSQLELTTTDFNPTTDSVSYRFSYKLLLDHGDPSLPTKASGHMLLVLAADRDGSWSICRWQDWADTSATTWSVFKGKFSN
jgi:hypothetical protein